MKGADGTKAATQLTQNRSGQVHVIVRVLKTGRRWQENRSEWPGWDRPLLALKMEGGHEPLGTRKGRDMDSPERLQKERSPADSRD